MKTTRKTSYEVTFTSPEDIRALIDVFDMAGLSAFEDALRNHYGYDENDIQVVRNISFELANDYDLERLRDD